MNLTFSGGQHSIQPLVQSVVTVDVRRVSHDRGGLLIGCSVTLQSNISLQDHSIAWWGEITWHRLQSTFVKESNGAHAQCATHTSVCVCLFTCESFVGVLLAVDSVKPSSQQTVGVANNTWLNEEVQHVSTGRERGKRIHLSWQDTHFYACAHVLHCIVCFWFHFLCG